MTAAQLQTLSVIVGLAVSAITVYYLVRSNIRDQVRQRNEEREKDVADARAPLIADNVRLSSECAALKVELQRRADRITQLEDLLYRRGGTST